jgi:hypothetical protein
MMRGTKADLLIHQTAATAFKPALYVERASEAAVRTAVAALQANHPGVGFRREHDAWRIVIPEKYEIGHEAHFAQVMESFLRYLRIGRLPEWETAAMLTKYATTMSAFELSRAPAHR